MIFNMTGASAGSSYEDGNDIVYPISVPVSENKLYDEMAVQNIALAIGGGSFTISEMAAAIHAIHRGLHATEVVIATADYTSSPLQPT